MRLDREALRQRMLVQGHDCPEEQVDALVPVLERTLPLIAAMRTAIAENDEPAVSLHLRPRSP